MMDREVHEPSVRDWRSLVFPQEPFRRHPEELSVDRFLALQKQPLDCGECPIPPYHVGGNRTEEIPGFLGKNRSPMPVGDMGLTGFTECVGGPDYGLGKHKSLEGLVCRARLYGRSVAGCRVDVEGDVEGSSEARQVTGRQERWNGILDQGIRMPLSPNDD